MGQAADGAKPLGLGLGLGLGLHSKPATGYMRETGCFCGYSLPTHLELPGRHHHLMYCHTATLPPPQVAQPWAHCSVAASLQQQMQNLRGSAVVLDRQDTGWMREQGWHGSIAEAWLSMQPAAMAVLGSCGALIPALQPSVVITLLPYIVI